MNLYRIGRMSVLSLAMLAVQAGAIEAPAPVARAATPVVADPAAVAAQKAVAAAPALPLQDILDRYAQARGGLDAWRKVQAALTRKWLSAIDKPMVVTVLPSPNGVGVIAVTSMSFPSFLALRRCRIERSTLAFHFP